MVGLSRFELLTPRLSSVCSNQLSYRPSRTARRPFGPTAVAWVCTPPVNEPLTGSLKTRQSAAHKNRAVVTEIDLLEPLRPPLLGYGASARQVSRKEVIQPQVLLQLPCYDFTPITDHTLSTCFPCGLAQRFLVQPAFVM